MLSGLDAWCGGELDASGCDGCDGLDDGGGDGDGVG